MSEGIVFTEEIEKKEIMEALKSLNLWNLLGRGITIIMIPWMTWVTFMIQNVMRDQAVMANRLQDFTQMIAEIQSLRDRMTSLEVRFQYMAAESRANNQRPIIP